MGRCFAERIGGRCGILYTDKCDKYSCKFYKTREELSYQIEKCEKRCRKLGIPFGREYEKHKKRLENSRY